MFSDTSMDIVSEIDGSLRMAFSRSSGRNKAAFDDLCSTTILSLIWGGKGKIASMGIEDFVFETWLLSRFWTWEWLDVNDNLDDLRDPEWRELTGMGCKEPYAECRACRKGSEQFVGLSSRDLQTENCRHTISCSLTIEASKALIFSSALCNLSRVDANSWRNSCLSASFSSAARVRASICQTLQKLSITLKRIWRVRRVIFRTCRCKSHTVVLDSPRLEG